jgi:hypothetical protein
MWVVLNSKSTSWNPVERLIFPAPTASYNATSFPNELIFIPRNDGQKVPCLLLPFKHARFLVIYFHANAEDLGLCYSFCKIMRDLFQVHVLAVEYPGYGICPGRTDEAGIMANARAAVYFATESLHWPCDSIKLFGRSLGTGPTMALATQYPVSGVILVSPFTSIQDLFRSQVGPFADFVEDRFKNCELAAKVLSATLIIHGQQDTLIPLAHGKQIYDVLSSRKMMVCPAQMGHNTSLLKNIGTFVLPMTQFFSLPDYTFEDIEVPSWVFPDHLCGPDCRRPAAFPSDEGDEEESAAQANGGSLQISARGPGGASQGLSPMDVGQPRGQRGDDAEATVVQPVRLSPRLPRGSYIMPNELKVSRNYEFGVERECEPQGSDANGGVASDAMPQEVIAAIDDRITWMVETNGNGSLEANAKARPQQNQSQLLTNLITV